MQTLKDIAHVQDCLIPASSSVKEALDAMTQNSDGSVILIEDGKPVGFISESNIVASFKHNIDFDAPALHLISKRLITLNENLTLDAAFDVLSDYDVRRIILIDPEGYCTGVVYQEDLLEGLEADVYKIELRISHVIGTQSSPITLQTDASVRDALDVMQEKGTAAVVVLQNETPVGIIAQSDILRLTHEKSSLDDTIQTHMTFPIYSVNPSTFIVDAMAMMRSKHIRHLLVRDANGGIVSLLTHRDILKQIKGSYTQSLQVKVKHAQEIMDYFPDSIVEAVETENYFMIHWMNKKAKNEFGDVLMQHPITALMSFSQLQSLLFDLKRFKSVEKMLIKINERMYELSATLSDNFSKRYIKLIFKDITEHEQIKRKLQKEIDYQIEKRMENEYLLMQQSKLATMGEMIGNIAHQWRQPLAELGGIFMNIDAENKFKQIDQEYLKGRIDAGNELLKYMSRTIDDFRHFFDPNRSKETFDVIKYIESAISIIQASFTYHHIAVERRFDEESVQITGFPGEFSQVILNLLANAKDALVERKIAAPKIVVSLYSDASNLHIVVEDNAGGIDPEIMEQIFNIYFTTKSRDDGTGLGLYMSRLIVETKLQGRIDVKNGDTGACFSIELPLK